MRTYFPKIAAVLALLILAACGTPPADEGPKPAATLPGYEAVQDGEFFIPAVEMAYLWGNQARAEVDYAGDERPGSIIVDTHSRRLYFVLEGGRAMRFSIAVGREGLAFRGSGVIGRKEEWPSWTPTTNMVRTRPDLYAAYAGGLPGGLSNPLGARAMYLYRNGKDTMFRIHGTIDNASISHATSAGCIRLFNQDAIYLYDRVEMGAQVYVRSLEDSIRIEGPYMDDAWGRAVPETPENIAQLEIDKRKIIAVADAEALRLEHEAATQAETLAVDEAAAARAAAKAARRAAADA